MQRAAGHVEWVSMAEFNRAAHGSVGEINNDPNKTIITGTITLALKISCQLWINTL